MFCECRDILVRNGRAVLLRLERLTLPGGRISTIVGANGSGKTTLLEVIALLRRPTDGEVLLWGEPARAGDRKLRQRLVMVMHAGYMFRGSVWKNVLYGLKARGVGRAEAARRAAEALSAVGLLNLARRSAAGLSAGERQRVNLARAIAIQPEAILLDEPIANLDGPAVDLVAGLLRELCYKRGTTVVCTSPGNGLLTELADHVVELENQAAGRALRDAPPVAAEPAIQRPAEP